MYYSYNRILSFNAFLNFLIGERGVGKTYGAVKFVTKEFIKKGHQFVYLRRYKSDLKKSIPTLFTSLITNNEFSEHELTSKGNNLYIDGKLAGYGFTLSTAQDLKSANFDKVKYIIFDEFIIDEGTKKYYLNNEVEVFLNLLESVSRMRKTKVFLLGNAGNLVTNPYFIYFNLSLPNNSDIRTFKNGLILLQYMKNEEYRKEKAKSLIGQLTAGTNYEKYAYQNQDTHINSDFIEHKKASSHFDFAFIYNSMTFGVWLDFKERKDLCFSRLH